jgi:hypothetical protein
MMMRRYGELVQKNGGRRKSGANAGFEAGDVGLHGAADLPGKSKVKEWLENSLSECGY